MANTALRAPVAAAPLSLVLVGHNAGGDVETVVAQWIAQLDIRKTPFEIIVVDHSSADAPSAAFDALVARDDRVRVINHSSGPGFGAALKLGIEAARYPLLACCTCDRQYEPADLKLLLEQIDKVDLVTGYRKWLTVPKPLQWLGRLWRLGLRIVLGASPEPLPSWLGDNGQKKRWLARWAFGVRVHDVDCALRLFRREVFKRLPIQSNGPFALAEILAKSNFLGCLMAEVPVTYHPPSSLPVQGSLNPERTYLSEARRVFSHPTFGTV